MKIKKLKSIQIFSNGSVNFSYKTLNDLNTTYFLERDHKTFFFNLKKNKIKNNVENFSNYKTKYL
jgi:hypothetical protein